MRQIPTISLINLYNLQRYYTVTLHRLTTLEEINDKKHKAPYSTFSDFLRSHIHVRYVGLLFYFFNYFKYAFCWTNEFPTMELL